MGPATSPPKFVTLILLTALSTLSLNMFLPSLPNIADDLGTSYATASIAIAGYLGLTAVLLLIIGPISDRIGRRPMVLIALVTFVLSSVMCALTQSIWTFLAFRMLQGAIASGYALSMAIIRDTAPQKQAGAMIGKVGMIMAIAPLLGPMLGGFLDSTLGWRANFWFYAIFGVGLLCMCWSDLGETHKSAQETTNKATHHLRTILTQPLFWAYAMCTASSRGSFYIYISGVPLVVASYFDASTLQIGLFIGTITAGFMFGSFLASRAPDRFAPHDLMTAGRVVAILGITIGILGWSVDGLTPALFVFSAISVGIGNGITIPHSSAASLSVRPDLAGSAAGAEGALTVAGGALLTGLTGVMLTAHPNPVTQLLLMLGVCVLGLFVIRWGQSQSTPHADT